MKRGEIWTIAGGAEYAGKPRPAVIIHNDDFDATQSVTICPLTTDPTESPLMRIPVQATEGSGLREPSRLMIDKITTVPRARLGSRIGLLDAETLNGLNRAAITFLGLA